MRRNGRNVSTHLPDDFARWPESAFEILGVQPGVSPRDLRRAYTNLIRVYKPEHYPDQFRRIREAFETLQRYAFYYQSESAPDEDGSASVHSPPLPSLEEAVPSDPATPSVEDLWKAAGAGEPFKAYRELARWLERRPRQADLYARLYWLAVLYPDVEPTLTPAEWLVRGLDQTEFSPGLFAVYLSAIQHDPSEAASDRFARLIARANSQERLTSLYRCRWEALSRVSSWPKIHRDLLAIREKKQIVDESSWLPLFVDLYRWIGWGRSDETALELHDELRRELKAIEHVGVKFGYFFDQLEWLDAVAESCRWIRSLEDPHGFASEFLGALRNGSSGSTERYRVSFENVLRRISDEPVLWLEWFDTFGPEGTAALSQFGNLLTSYESELAIEIPWPHPPDELRELVTEIMDESRAYHEFRAAMLGFCLNESIAPSVVFQAFSPGLGGADPVPARIQKINEDLSLQIVCRSASVFRA
jgi:hypothetical protein